MSTFAGTANALNAAYKQPMVNNMELDFYRLFEPVQKAANEYEIERWKVSGVFPKSLVGVELRAPQGAFVRYTSRKNIEDWFFKTFPIELSDVMSVNWSLKIYGDEIADRSAIGVPPKEVSFSSMSIASTMENYSLAGSKWDINVMTPEGKQDLRMQIEQVTDGVINRIMRDALDTALLKSQVYYFDWAEKAYYPKIQVQKYLDLETSMFDCIAKRKNGLEWLTSQVINIQKLWKGDSDTLIMPLAAVEYLKHNRVENTDFFIAGSKTGGAKNSIDKQGAFGSILGKTVRVLEPYQNSVGDIDDILLERNIQIGWYNVMANTYGFQDPEDYSSKDMHVQLYDEDLDMYREITLKEALEHSALFDENGYLHPPTKALGGNHDTYGTGNIADLQSDFLSKPDDSNHNGRAPLRLLGEQANLDGEFFKFFGETAKNQLKRDYPGGVAQINDIMRRGRDLLDKLEAVPFQKDWFDRFAALNVNPGNVVSAPTDRKYRVPAGGLQQLGTNQPTGSFYWLPTDARGRLRKLPMGAASMWGLEELSRQTSDDPALMADINAAKEYVSLMNKVSLMVKNVLPRSPIVDDRLTPLAVRNKSVANSVFANVDSANKCFVWLNKELFFDDNVDKLFTIDTSSAMDGDELVALANKIFDGERVHRMRAADSSSSMISSSASGRSRLSSARIGAGASGGSSGGLADIDGSRIGAIFGNPAFVEFLAKNAAFNALTAGGDLQGMLTNLRDTINKITSASVTNKAPSRAAAKRLKPKHAKKKEQEQGNDSDSDSDDNGDDLERERSEQQEAEEIEMQEQDGYPSGDDSNPPSPRPAAGDGSINEKHFRGGNDQYTHDESSSSEDEGGDGDTAKASDKKLKKLKKTLDNNTNTEAPTESRIRARIGARSQPILPILPDRNHHSADGPVDSALTLATIRLSILSCLALVCKIAAEQSSAAKKRKVLAGDGKHYDAVDADVDALTDLQYIGTALSYLAELEKHVVAQRSSLGFVVQRSSLFDIVHTMGAASAVGPTAAAELDAHVANVTSFLTSNGIDGQLAEDVLRFFALKVDGSGIVSPVPVSIRVTTANDGSFSTTNKLVSTADEFNALYSSVYADSYGRTLADAETCARYFSPALRLLFSAGDVSVNQATSPLYQQDTLRFLYTVMASVNLQKASEQQKEDFVRTFFTSADPSKTIFENIAGKVNENNALFFNVPATGGRTAAQNVKRFLLDLDGRRKADQRVTDATKAKWLARVASVQQAKTAAAGFLVKASSRDRNAARNHPSNFVQTSMLFSPQLISTYVDWLRSSGYMHGAGEALPMLASSAEDADRCGDLEELFALNDKIREANYYEDYPSSVKHMRDSLYTTLQDTYFVSQVLIGSTSAAKRAASQQAASAGSRAGFGGNSVYDDGDDVMEDDYGTTGLQQQQQQQAFGSGRGGASNPLLNKFQSFGAAPSAAAQPVHRRIAQPVRRMREGIYGRNGAEVSLADLNQRNITAVVLNHFNHLSNSISCMLTMMIARVYILSSYHLDNFVKFDQCNLPLPLELGLFTPFARYSGYASFYVASGGKAGYTVMGNPRYTVGNDPTEQRYYHQFAATGGLVLTDPRFMFLTRNVMITERNGGASTAFYKAAMQAKDAENYFNPRAHRYGNNGESLFVVPLPLGFHKSLPDHLDITGRDYRFQKMGLVRQQDMTELQYPSAYRFCCTWGINGAAIQPSSTQGFSRDVDGKQPNTTLMRGQTIHWDRASKSFSGHRKVVCNTHWGEEGTYAGCQKARAGVNPFGGDAQKIAVVGSV
jgi:hypothetical protein